MMTTGAATDNQKEPAQVESAGMMMMTILLRHDQSKTIEEMNEHLTRTGWFKSFPPENVEIVSWYVMMGIGNAVTLRFPAERLRAINRVIEGSAWGAYRTEFYPTYDYLPVWKAIISDAR